MKVLLVDDEPRVLEALERMVLELADSWDVTCAASGADALTLLARDPHDVVVSDMRMPGMDGAELLAEVQRLYPDTTRFVLSGETNRGCALRAVRVAHQFLTKPCSAATLVGGIQRSYELNGRITSNVVRSIVSGTDRLPCVPAVHRELEAAIAVPDFSLDTAAAIIAKDPAMAAKLLQVVNSGFFSRGAGVNDVKAAVIRLGVEVVTSLVLVVGAFASVDCSMSEAELSQLQRSAAKAAAIARKIAEASDVADACTAALLGDIGQLVLACGVPPLAAEARQRAKATCTPLSVVENELIGATHTDVGAHLLAKWGLPQRIITAVASSDDLSRDPARDVGVSAVVHFARRVAAGKAVDEAYFAEVGETELLERWKHVAASVMEGC